MVLERKLFAAERETWMGQWATARSRLTILPPTHPLAIHRVFSYPRVKLILQTRHRHHWLPRRRQPLARQAFLPLRHREGITSFMSFTSIFVQRITAIEQICCNRCGHRGVTRCSAALSCSQLSALSFLFRKHKRRVFAEKAAKDTQAAHDMKEKGKATRQKHGIRW